jgi:hypothetical protein
MEHWTRFLRISPGRASVPAQEDDRLATPVDRHRLIQVKAAVVRSGQNRSIPNHPERRNGRRWRLVRWNGRGEGDMIGSSIPAGRGTVIVALSRAELGSSTPLTVPVTHATKMVLRDAGRPI